MDSLTRRSKRRISPVQFIMLSFFSVILLGTILLLLPVSHRPGVSVTFMDAFFTATSAVCVTGLVVVDTLETFTPFGCTVVALLIQVGGLGVASIGVALIMLSGRKVAMRSRTLVKEALNQGSFKGILSLVKWVLLVTIGFELVGALLSFVVFVQDMPVARAIGTSLFHAVASFNNAGFDMLGGGMANLIPYESNTLLLLVTAALIIFGGLGFFVIQDLCLSRGRKLRLHTKVVLVTTIALLAVGTVLLKLTDDVSWLGAFFMSTSARTAGFTVYDLGAFSNAGLFVLCLLMFVGASPGSTGGGVKTTTLFVLIRAVYARIRNRNPCAFKRSLPQELIYKSFVLVVIAMSLVFLATFLLCVMEPELAFIDLLHEAFSAFGTVGLSAGITPQLSTGGRLVLIPLMFIGRIGPLTVAALWSFRLPSDAAYAEEPLPIG